MTIADASIHAGSTAIRTPQRGTEEIAFDAITFSSFHQGGVVWTGVGEHPPRTGDASWAMC